MEDNEMSEDLIEETEVTTVGEADVQDLEEAKDVEVVDERAVEVRKQAKAIRTNMERAYFDLAELIHTILSEDYFRFYGFENIWDYVEEELEIKKRTGQYLISIFEFLKKLKEEGFINEVEELKTIGWTKVKELVSVADGENIAYWIDQAKQCSSRQLEDLRKEYVASKNSEGGEDGEEGSTAPKDVDKKTPYNVKFYSENYAVFSDALELAKEKTGKEDKETLLVAMASSFMANESDNLDERLNGLEVSEGVRLVAIKDGEIVYGEDAVDEILGEEGEEEEYEEEAEEEVETEEVEAEEAESDTIQL